MMRKSVIVNDGVWSRHVNLNNYIHFEVMQCVSKDGKQVLDNEGRLQDGSCMLLRGVKPKPDGADPWHDHPVDFIGEFSDVVGLMVAVNSLREAGMPVQLLGVTGLTKLGSLEPVAVNVLDTTNQPAPVEENGLGRPVDNPNRADYSEVMAAVLVSMLMSYVGSGGVDQHTEQLDDEVRRAWRLALKFAKIFPGAVRPEVKWDHDVRNICADLALQLRRVVTGSATVNLADMAWAYAESRGWAVPK